MTENQVLTGVVCWMARGIGFITRDDGSGDIFVHWTNIEMDGYKTLKAGQIVSFEIGENHKGPQALKVKILKDAPKDK